MDYRTRWQQRRRRQRQRRTLMGLGAVGIVAGIAFLIGRLPRMVEVWQLDLGPRSPVYFRAEGETLVCGGMGAKAVAVYTTTGHPFWPQPLRRQMGFGAPPAVSRTKCVFVSDDGTVSTVARASGEVVWEVETGAAVRCPPLIAHGRVFVGSDDGNLYAFGLHDGAERWRYGAGSAICSGCALAGDTLVFGTVDGRIIGLDWRSGRPVWPPLEVQMPVSAQPLALGTTAFVPTDWGRVYVVDASTGTQAGQLQMPECSLIRAAPVLDSARIYTATTEGWLVAHDLGSWQRLWARPLGAGISAGPAQDEALVYCGLDNSRLVAVSKADGRVWRRWKCSSRPQGSLVVVGGLVIVGMEGGRVVAYRAAAG